MTQPSFSAWCETLQAKLMAAIDAAWAILEASDDPAAIRQARDRAKACGELAAVVRKLAAMTSQGRAKPPAEAPPAPAVLAAAAATASAQVEHAVRALEKLKARRRGRL